MYNPKSLENLQPFGTMDADRQRELSRRGGLASAEARRHNRERRKMMDAMLKYGHFFQMFLEIADMTPEQMRRELKKIGKSRHKTD